MKSVVVSKSRSSLVANNLALIGVRGHSNPKKVA